MTTRAYRRSWLGMLDPRTKLLLQIAFVAAAYVHTEPVPLALLAGLGILVIRLGGQSPRSTLWEFRALGVFLGFAPLVAGIRIRPASFVVDDAVAPALAAFRVLLVVLVSVAIVRTTAPREVEAALRWLMPGRIGRALATGVGLVFRFVPVIRSEANRTRQAVAMRGGDELPLHRRIHLVGVVTLVRLLRRSDRVSRALRVRCLAWNATVPPLSFSRLDAPAILGSLALLAWALAGVVP